MFTKTVNKATTKLRDRKYANMTVAEMAVEQKKGLLALKDNDWDKFLTHFHINNFYLLGDSISAVVEANNFDFLLKLRDLLRGLVNGHNFFYGSVINESIIADNLEMFKWGFEKYWEKEQRIEFTYWIEVGERIFNPMGDFKAGQVAHFYIIDSKTDKNWLSQFSASLKNQEARQFIESCLDKINLDSQIEKDDEVDIGISEKMPDKPFKV